MSEREQRSDDGAAAGREDAPKREGVATSSGDDRAWHAWAVDDLSEELSVDPARGLEPDDVESRRREFGRNELAEGETTSAWRILVDQLNDPIFGLLLAAGIAALALGQVVEAVAVAAVIVINAAVGFAIELQARRSVQALDEMTSTDATVRRAGSLREIDAAELVPGDVVVLDAGDVVGADIRLTEANKLQADESALTGESVPVVKEADPNEPDTNLAERSGMVYKGTAITRGAGEGIVVATGMATEIGTISELTRQAEDETTPLEKRLGRLGGSLIWVTIGVAALVGVVGWLAGKDLLLIIETSVALAVAAIPEGLPIIATIALARGTLRMARHNALVTQLSSVETLGATNVICTDKTGTLTENQMTLRRVLLAGREVEVEREAKDGTDGEADAGGSLADVDGPLERLLTAGVLCVNAELPSEDDEEDDEAIGDPVEIALLRAGRRAGLRRDELLERHPEVREDAFDSASKRMATVHEEADGGGYLVAAKGALEAILPGCASVLDADGERDLDDDERNHWHDENQRLAAEGLRVLALASKRTGDADADPYEDLTLLGLVGLLDPPREEIRGTLEACRQAGIRVVMVTGDQPATARQVGLAVGLIDEDAGDPALGDDLRDIDRHSDEERRRLLAAPIFARVNPEQKLNLIALHQADGDIVAMTGDGVNDAPALKKADIGIAMGQRGTQVAQEAAKMILRDDAFGTIVTAIRLGRSIFDNIRNFTIYMLSGNIGEILAVAAATLAGAPLPLLPLQILYINLVNDVFPALALGVGEGDEGMMSRPPRDPEEPILPRETWWAIGAWGVLIGAAVLGSFAWALTRLGLDGTEATTISFLSLSLARLWHTFNMRNVGSGIFDNEIVRNGWVWAALALCLGLLALAVYLPGLSDVLKLSPPSPTGWLVVAVFSVIPYLVGQVVLEVMARRE